MFELKGFINNATFTNNSVAGGVAQIGELSQLSLTYSQDIGWYKSSLTEDCTLVSFKSASGDTFTQLTSNISDHVLTIAQGIFTYANTNGQIFSDTLLQWLLTTYGSVANTFTCGNIITDGTNYMPEWVAWSNTSIPAIQGSGGNAIKIWFVDASFQTEYDEYTIVVIPPIANLATFFQPASILQTALNAVLPADLFATIQAAKNGYPETILRCDTFNYIDPNNANTSIPTNWYTLIYGNAGNNVDAVGQAIINYILANSNQNQAAWTTIIPSLFLRTEFVILPLWTQYAIPNSNLQNGIYSPIANSAATLELLEQVDSGYATQHISANMTIMSHPYKSLAIASIGSPANKNSWFQLQQVFPDFLNILSTDNDFERMTQSTQGFANMLAQMLITAESMTAGSILPSGMTKMTRASILYLVQNYEGIYYLVAAKTNFPLS
jgi:hypothetical protein